MRRILCGCSRFAPRAYQEVNVWVQLQNGSLIEAYVYSDDLDVELTIQSGDWRKFRGGKRGLLFLEVGREELIR